MAYCISIPSTWPLKGGPETRWEALITMRMFFFLTAFAVNVVIATDAPAQSGHGRASVREIHRTTTVTTRRALGSVTATPAPRPAPVMRAQRPPPRQRARVVHVPGHYTPGGCEIRADPRWSALEEERVVEDASARCDYPDNLWIVYPDGERVRVAIQD